MIIAEHIIQHTFTLKKYERVRTMKETLCAVIQTLCHLFEDKAELRGFDDWNRFVGCIMALEQIANTIPEQENEVVDNG